ncbi:MAG: mandelate racemase/muconate lactonizing enzyme family protein [Bacteroidota bacterium]
MSTSRREFLQTGFLATAALSCGKDTTAEASKTQALLAERYALLDEALNRPVLRRELFPEPILIESCELLQQGQNYLCRVRASTGAVGYSISNNYQMRYLYPIATQRVNPFFIGKDARDLEQLLEEVYVYRSNYKLQSLALWVPVATVEFAILDLLGQIAGEPIGKLLARAIHHPTIAVYQANNYRGQSAEASLAQIVATAESTGARAVKFKLGGRMSQGEHPSGRSEALIPMVRAAFGEEMTIYADANGSYEVEEAIRIGRLMEAHNYDFYEEPVAFDDYEGTRQVAAALDIPIAGGEQEPSLRNFRWLLANEALQIVQPDIFYFGGMVRSLRVARMAAVMGLECVPHISGSGLGWFYMMHFCSALPNAGPFHEFKGFQDDIDYHCATSDLQLQNGTIKVPTGPGLGLDFDPDFLAGFTAIST